MGWDSAHLGRIPFAAPFEVQGKQGESAAAPQRKPKSGPPRKPIQGANRAPPSCGGQGEGGTYMSRRDPRKIRVALIFFRSNNQE